MNKRLAGEVGPEDWEPLSKKIFQLMVEHFEDGSDLIHNSCVMLASLKMADFAVREVLKEQGIELTEPFYSREPHQ